MKETLDFKTLDEAVEFWETHDSTDYWDDMEEVAIEVDLQRNSSIDCGTPACYATDSFGTTDIGLWSRPR